MNYRANRGGLGAGWIVALVIGALALSAVVAVGVLWLRSGGGLPVELGGAGNVYAGPAGLSWAELARRLRAGGLRDAEVGAFDGAGFLGNPKDTWLVKWGQTRILALRCNSSSEAIARMRAQKDRMELDNNYKKMDQHVFVWGEFVFWDPESPANIETLKNALR